ncbi:DUF397 domain-containing protein [Amycolatopsis anabasis]|uniref:DUF397 domain-containing protein n=1 Tax=Amycolatopsis anabasis TaxID=1840409 RepID=UPI00131E7B66|nr:DUF397 domain-containing protein [Amycolatopsis anabasis]
MPEWRKSSRSVADDKDGDCVEVAFLAPSVAVRDSKLPEGGTLLLPASAWAHFVGEVRRGAE